MKRVAIDVRMAEDTGIGRYIRGTVSHLLDHPSPFRYTLIGRRKGENHFGGEAHWIGSDLAVYGIGEQIRMPLLARSVECLHVPHYNAPLMWDRRLVITIHDLIHLHYPEYLPSRAARWYARCLLPMVTAKAAAIIAVSEHTRQDLIETLGVAPQKVTVIHHGVDGAFKAPGKQLLEERKGEVYFLYVGLLKAHKNVGVLLDAFRELIQEKVIPNLKLKLVGRADWKQPIVRRWIESIRTEPAVSLTEWCSDQELIGLYRGATALVFPSLYEGFGFPLVEAMASGTPVIAARTSSIPEVMGETAAVYFDPRSPSELKQWMKSVLGDRDLRLRLVGEGIKRAACFDWDAAAKKTEHVYESVLGS